MPGDNNLIYLAGLLGNASEIKFEKELGEIPDTKEGVEQTQVSCSSLLVRSICFLPGKLSPPHPLGIFFSPGRLPGSPWPLSEIS